MAKSNSCFESTKLVSGSTENADVATAVEATRRGASSHGCGTADDTEGAEDLLAEAAADDPRNRVTNGTETLFFEHTTGDVATHRTTDQADDQPEDPVHVPLLLSTSTPPLQPAQPPSMIRGNPSVEYP